MEEPNNLCEILEIAAENQWQHGLLINLPQGWQRDTTQYSKYDVAFNHKEQPEETQGPGEGEQDGHPEDSKEPEDDRPQLPTGWISYKTLLNNVRTESHAVEALMNMHGAEIVLICTDNQLDHIHWFWAVVCAGGVPCMATKFSDDLEQRKKQILNLKETLNNPLILTSSNLRGLFADDDSKDLDELTLWTFSEIQKSRDRILEHRPPPISHGCTQWVSTNPSSGLRRLHTVDYNGLSVFTKGHTKGVYELAVLMLTSGSTGNAKAVCLTSAQIIASVQGKSAAHNTTPNDVFFSWTGMDHVANLAEIHLHAMYLGANQIMVSVGEVADPLAFLKRIHDHRVTYTFAPNFFLGDLLKSIPDTSVILNADDRLDLSCLRALVSGGELNDIKTCTQLTALLTQLGAPESFIRPAFGMTETCAGCTYNVFDCPVYDIYQNNQYACLGYGMQGAEIQISEEGELLLRGPAIFEGYFNNEIANADAFDEEGWFHTGDLGRLDENFRLHLEGRIKDMVVINAICHPPQGIEGAIEDAAIPGVTPTFTVAFGIRVDSFHTESLVIVYLPQEGFNDPATRVLSATAISKAVFMYCGVRPYKIVPVSEGDLEKSSLGKLPRSKIKMSFEAGDFDKYMQDNLPVTIDRFGAAGHSVGINDDLFSLGISSLDILGIKVGLQKSLGIRDIQITTFFSNPTLSDLAGALEKLMPSLDQLLINELSLEKSQFPEGIQMNELVPYNPVVLLNPNTGNCTKPPVFFFHPGVGEVLVFLNISRHFKDRPVYALRAKGFNGESYHNTFDEVVQCYLKCVAEWDPKGKVGVMDVFYTGPLVGLVKATTIKEWLDGHISKWDEYVEDVKYHEVEGTHRTLISPPNLQGFWGVFEAAMEARGV
ncbi:acetyl-CoA synthetase-like protein [Acephala macrosclerotiorum]|nr:acetyl-CoA synthetase-like protein [Acephala macrosclerotiorum]